ncbi:unnamed protein product [Arctia plantaginis]|uniref:Epidermal growth factor receptor substrate 15-like 1 n=1 Tax=Arctia plantaginis TaxID=874455 RepID=A0A8S1AGF1_ARCPL|nr:unnamed protein product [Arctia plantaginis]
MYNKTEPALNLGPQPTPELEAIAREVDALARERLALEAEVAAKQRELTVKSGEADSLQSELDTLTATLKQLENQKGEAQKRLNDLKSQVEKLRAQVSAQESAAAETEAELAARRAAALTLKEKERALQAEVTDAEAEAEAITAQLRKTVLAVSQANIKISHLEEQHRILEEAVEALAGSGAVPHTILQLQPQYTAEHLERVVRGATPNDALEESPFANRNGFAGAGGGFDADPFSERATADPFAPAGTTIAQDAFGTDPFTSNADPFAGDTFASQDHTAKANDVAWEEDPFAVLHAPVAGGGGGGGGGAGGGGPALPPKQHKTPPPRPAPPRPTPPHKTVDRSMDFTDDPFKDYRYEDPFNIEDPFADVNDPKRADPFGRPTSVAGFETDDFFSPSSNINGNFTLPDKRSGRVSAPPVAYDPFATRSDFKPPKTTSTPSAANNNDSWAAWPNDNWATDDAWAKPATKKSEAWTTDDSTKNINTSNNDWKTDNWANKSDNWAADFGSSDNNKNLNETWPSSTLPNKKEKSPKPVRYARSLVHTIGGIGRTKQKEKKKAALEARSADMIPTEEQQWAWASSESKRLQDEAEERRRREDAELQLALAISRQEK